MRRALLLALRLTGTAEADGQFERPIEIRWPTFGQPGLCTTRPSSPSTIVALARDEPHAAALGEALRGAGAATWRPEAVAGVRVDFEDARY